MRLATARWLDSGAVSAMGWSERVRREDIAAFEARVRAEGATGYRVFDRTDAVAPLEGWRRRRRAEPVDGGDVIAVRLIEPLQGNAAALGVNGAVDPGGARGDPAGGRHRPAGRDGGLSPDPAGRATTSGWASSSTRRSTTARSAGDRAAPRRAARRRLRHPGDGHAARAAWSAQVPAYLKLCVVDADPLAARRRLAGRAGCEAERAAPASTSARSSSPAGSGSSRVSAEPDDVPDGARPRAPGLIAARRPAVGGDARRARS